jgi:protein-S-isoprenylcysteine O-methyltransferase Ste14
VKKMAVYLVVLAGMSAVWVGYEVWLVLVDRRRGKGSARVDRGTRDLNFISILVGIGGAAALSSLSRFFFPGGRTVAVFWIGILAMLAGLGLRIWAVSTLGAAFRTTVETHSGQKVIQQGPYRLIRHPSYSGILLMCLGYGVAVQNWLSLAAAVLLPLAALLYRMRVEEAALRESLGPEYAEYQRRTRRLIPWVW